VRRWARRGVAVGALASLATLAVPAAALALGTTPDRTYQTNGRVSAIETIGNTVYIGGSFTRVRPAGAAAGTQEVVRNHIAALDATTGNLLPWNPNANGDVRALAASADGSTIFVGGGFGTIAGAARHRFAALSANANAAAVNQPGWGDLNTSATVMAIAASSSKVFIGGDFLTVSGQSRVHLAAFDTPNGGSAHLDSSWTPTAQNPINSPKYPNAKVFAMALDGSRLFVGGAFSSLDNLSGHRNLDALDLTTGHTSLWKYHPGFPIYDVIPTATRVYMAGDGSGGNVAGIDTASQSLSNSNSWALQTDGGIQALAHIGSTLYIGGHFDNVCSTISSGGQGFQCQATMATRHKIIAVPDSGHALDPWYPGANSNLGVFALDEGPGGRLEMGGDFTRAGRPNSSLQASYAQQGFAQFS
jgi:hypothetical protein